MILLSMQKFSRAYLPFLLCTMLFCCTEGDLFAKGRSKLTVVSDELKGVQLYLNIHRGAHIYPVDSAILSSKGKAVFKLASAPKAGEYSIATKDSLLYRLFFSTSQNIREYIDLSDINKQKGGIENRIFLTYQQMIADKWREYQNSEQFAEELLSVIKEGLSLEGTLLQIYLLYQFPQQSEENRDIVDLLLNDPRLLNTSILHSFVKNQLTAINSYPIDDIILFCDLFISKSRDSEIKTTLAYLMFEYFYNSNVMGHESVAIHIADNYFLNDYLKWPDEGGLELMKLFTEFNRHSLLGMTAPDITLFTPDFDRISILDSPSEYKILYFYNDNCSTCKHETPRLISTLNGYDNFSLYLIYTESDFQRMSDYNSSIEERLDTLRDKSTVNVTFLWDPASESGYEKLFSVLRTPQLFLLDRENRVIGRDLSSENLKTILDALIADKNEEIELFKTLFIGASVDEAIVRIDYLYNSLTSDPVLFRDLFYHLYFWLKETDLGDEKAVFRYLAQQYILQKTYLWRANSDFVDKVKMDLNSQ